MCINEVVKCLGIYLGHNKQECDVKNWTNKLDVAKRMLNQWKRRNLTMFGKVVIIRTMIMPIVIYFATVLQPPGGFVKELSNLLNNFMGIKRYRLSKSNIIGK